MNNLYTFAATEPAQGGSVFTMLGIDMGTLIFQIIAFLILVFVLGKWVYPVFINIIDKRQAAIDEGLKAAHEAQAQASESEAEIARLLKEARAEASDIVTTAKEEASLLVQNAETKAKDKSQAIVDSAKDQIEKEVIAAKKALHNETIDLVALATEKVVGKVVSKQVDAKLVSEALKEQHT